MPNLKGSVRMIIKQEGTKTLEKSGICYLVRNNGDICGFTNSLELAEKWFKEL